MKYIAKVVVTHQVYVHADNEQEAHQEAERQYESLPTLWSPQVSSVEIERALS